ncbi:MAG: response regulator, partial [Bacteroidota bacterium]|nr:response regulator [Bacteroidota bacterium]
MKKILAIDDNLLNLELISAILNIDFPDYQVLLSQSGIEGIEIAKRELPDTILLDILMPEMDGFEVCHILKNNEQTRHIPILLVSALSEMSYRINGLNSGADAFISKPIDRAELKAQVNVMLRIKFAEDLLRKRNENLEILIKKQTAEFDSIEDRYLKVSEYALEYFWELDQSGQFTYVSPVIVKILGFGPEEIVGIKSLCDFCSYNENTGSRELLTDIFARRENFTGNEVLCSHKNGKKVWLTISGFPIFDGNNNFAGYIGVNHDITRRREAEEANKKHLGKIKEYQKKLKDLNYELAIAEEKERRKIAEYLHDGLGQTISIAAIKLSSIARGELPPAVKKILE